MHSYANMQSSPMIYCGIKTSNEDVLLVSSDLSEYASSPESTEAHVSGLLICHADVQW